MLEDEGEGEGEGEDQTQNEVRNKMIQDLDVDDDFEDYEQENANAPSTRKSKSQPLSETKSPFHGDSFFGFGGEQEEKPQEAKSAIIELEVPTKASQLERDMRSLKGHLDDQRSYLRKIQPESLKTIFKSSIEVENILSIVTAFNGAPQKWFTSNTEYLVNFLDNLTQVDRFGIVVGSLNEEESSEVSKLFSSLDSSISSLKESEEGDKEKHDKKDNHSGISVSTDLESKLSNIKNAFE